MSEKVTPCEHVWGTPSTDPHMDAGECIKCHVVWTSAEIARDRYRRRMVNEEFERAEDEYLGRTVHVPGPTRYA